MASRTVDLGGLPDIQQNKGFDMSSLIQLAHLLEVQNENEHKYGTPGKPGIKGIPAEVTPEASIVSRIYGGVDRVKTLPSNIPEGAIFAPGTKELLTAGQPVYLKRGAPEVPAIPGTPGSQELTTKAGIAHLLTPESAANMMIKKGFEGIKFAGTTAKRPAFYNPNSGEIKDPSQMGEADFATFRPTDMDTAIKEAGDIFRAKIHAGGQGRAETLRLYTELMTVKLKSPRQLNESQQSMIKALEEVLPEQVGIGGLTKIKRGLMEEQKTEYKTRKTKALGLIQQNWNADIPNAERIKNIKGIIDTLRNEYGELYDIPIQDEKKFLRGKGIFE